MAGVQLAEAGWQCDQTGAQPDVTGESSEDGGWVGWWGVRVRGRSDQMTFGKWW